MAETSKMSTRDNPETHRIVKRIYTKLSYQKEGMTFKDPNRARKLTGLAPHALEALEKGTNLDLTNKPVDRFVIHKALYNIYLEKGTLPTTKELFKALKDSLPAHMDIASFRTLLYRMDYVWKKIGIYVFVVLERPEITYERLNFLKQIIEYQDTCTPIFFVEEWVFPLTFESSYDDFTKTCDEKNGKERAVFAFSSSEMAFRNSILPANITETDYKNWIIRELILSLHQKSVIVTNTDHFCTDLFEYPTINSLKLEMTDWLDRHKVPYDERMSKIELWSLIKECTDINYKKTTLDDLICSYGHIPMKIPRHMHMLTPGRYLYEHVKEDGVFDVKLDGDIRENVITSKMNALDVAYLEQSVSVAMSQYKQVLIEDMALDEKFDDLIKKSKEKDACSDEDSDVPIEFDSD